MDDYSLTIEEAPSAADLQYLAESLYRHNALVTGDDGEFLTLFLRDSKRRLVGGLHGWTAYNWLHVDLLWIAESLRRKGWGRRLLEAAEEEASRRGCRYAELDTFDFQAIGFYLKSGYTIFGELADVAGSHKWYFLKKDLNRLVASDKRVR